MQKVCTGRKYSAQFSFAFQVLPEIHTVFLIVRIWVFHLFLNNIYSLILIYLFTINDILFLNKVKFYLTNRFFLLNTCFKPELGQNQYFGENK